MPAMRARRNRARSRRAAAPPQRSCLPRNPRSSTILRPAPRMDGPAIALVLPAETDRFRPFHMANEVPEAAARPPASSPRKSASTARSRRASPWGKRTTGRPRRRRVGPRFGICCRCAIRSPRRAPRTCRRSSSMMTRLAALKARIGGGGSRCRSTSRRRTSRTCASRPNDKSRDVMDRAASAALHRSPQQRADRRLAQRAGVAQIYYRLRRGRRLRGDDRRAGASTASSEVRRNVSIARGNLR